MASARKTRSGVAAATLKATKGAGKPQARNSEARAVMDTRNSTSDKAPNASKGAERPQSRGSVTRASGQAPKGSPAKPLKLQATAKATRSGGAGSLIKSGQVGKKQLRSAIIKALNSTQGVSNTRSLAIDTALKLGRGNDPMRAILVKAAVAAIDRGAADLTVIQADFQKLSGTLLGGEKSFEALSKAIASPEARKYYIDQLVSDEISKGTLVQTANGLVEKVGAGSSYLATLTQGVVAEATKALTKAEDLNAVRGVLLGAMQEAPTFLLDSSFPGAAQLASIIINGVLDDDGAKAANDLANALKAGVATAMGKDDKDVQNLLSTLASAPATIADLAEKANSTFEAIELSSSLDTLKAGAAAAHAVLTLACANPDLAEKIEQGVQTAQTAVQIAQAVGMLAACSTGVGAVFAASSLLGAVGGLGAFGSSKGDSGMGAVMAALQGLATEMRKSLAQVNQKLDKIIDKLDAISSDIKQLQKYDEAILSEVRDVLESIGGLYVLQERNSRRILSAIEEGLTEKVSAAILFNEPLGKSDRQMAAFHYAKAAAKAAGDASQATEHLNAKADKKEDVLGAQISQALSTLEWLTSGIDLERDYWSGYSALSFVLENGFKYEKSAPGPVHEGYLTAVLSTFVSLERLSPGFGEIGGTALAGCLSKVRSAMQAHDEVLAFVRGPARPAKLSDVPLLVFLLDRLKSIIGTEKDQEGSFFSSIVQLRKKQIDHILIDFEGNSPTLSYGVEKSTVAVYMQGTAPGPGYVEFVAFDRSTGARTLNQLFTRYVKDFYAVGPVNIVPPLSLEVRDGWQNPLKSGHDLNGNWWNTYRFKLKPNFYASALKHDNADVEPFHSFEVDVTLYFKEGETAEILNKEKSNAVVIINGADGGHGQSSGRDELIAALKSQLESPTGENWIGAAREVQRGRLKGNSFIANSQVGYAVALAKMDLTVTPEYVTYLRKAKDTITAIRAVSALAFPEAYAASTVLDSLFAGDSATRLVDEEVLTDWSSIAQNCENGPDREIVYLKDKDGHFVSGVNAAGKGRVIDVVAMRKNGNSAAAAAVLSSMFHFPSTQGYPDLIGIDEIALQRVKLLEHALGEMVKASAAIGPSYAYNSARGSFNAELRKYF